MLHHIHTSLCQVATVVMLSNLFPGIYYKLQTCHLHTLRIGQSFTILHHFMYTCQKAWWCGSDYLFLEPVTLVNGSKGYNHLCIWF